MNQTACCGHIKNHSGVEEQKSDTSDSLGAATVHVFARCRGKLARRIGEGIHECVTRARGLKEIVVRVRSMLWGRERRGRLTVGVVSLVLLQIGTALLKDPSGRASMATDSLETTTPMHFCESGCNRALGLDDGVGGVCGYGNLKKERGHS